MVLVAEKPMGVLGRIVIPEEVRELCNLQPGQMVEMYVDGPKVVLVPSSRPATSHCHFCGTEGTRLLDVNGKPICVHCAIDVAKVLGSGE